MPHRPPEPDRRPAPGSSPPSPARHRRRLSAKHLVLIALFSLLGSAGTFAAVTGSASAHDPAPPSASPSSSNSLPSVTDPTDNPPAGPSQNPDAPDSPDTSADPADPANPEDSNNADNTNNSHGPDSPSGTHVDQGGPSPDDFVDIRSVRPDSQRPRAGRDASTGAFTTRCGRNENGHNNPDNFIVTPGVSNGAHHLHDYVGNLSTDAFSTDDSLRAAGTTCARGDKSTYFWPVLRLRGTDADQEGGADGNVGRVLTPRSVSLTFLGNPTSKVTAMPEALRAITGDAKAATNGTANARAQWTCTGQENRRLTDKYPLCPRGSQVVRLLDFPSCWDGANTDSADHRGHLAFPDRADGSCPSGTRAVPQLRMRLTYAVPARPLAFAVDSFPEQLHKPVTDHADFANFMPRALMDTAVRCINSGRRCD